MTYIHLSPLIHLIYVVKCFLKIQLVKFNEVGHSIEFTLVYLSVFTQILMIEKFFLGEIVIPVIIFLLVLSNCSPIAK